MKSFISVTTVTLILAMFILPKSPISASGPQQENQLDSKVILFGTSNAEASPFDREDTGASRLAGLLGRDGADIREVNWAVPIPSDADLVILIGPSTDYSGAQIARLWAYMNQGGNLLLLADPSQISGRALAANSPLFQLLWTDFGIQMQDSILLNPAGDTPPPAPEQTQNEEGTPFPTPTPVVGESPAEQFGNLSKLTSHPILDDISIEGIMLNAARPLDVEAFVESAQGSGLLVTSELVYGEKDAKVFVDTGVYHYDSESDTPQRSYFVAAASENTQLDSRVVLIGDADLARNGFGFQTSPPGSAAFVFPETAKLILNAAYWLLNVGPPTFTFENPLPTATPTVTATSTVMATPETEDTGTEGE